MRHKKKFNHLSRKSAHRKAMLTNMAVSLIQHKRINTTVAKAKALRSFVEPIINRAKDDSQHSRRQVFRKLQDKNAVNELFREVAFKIAEREGGYTRILKTGTRLGDNAEMCFIELVDYNEDYTTTSKTKKTRRKRTRRGGSGSGSSQKSETENKSETEEATENPENSENKEDDDKKE